MPKIICTVPASTPKAQILETEAEFRGIYAEQFGTDKGVTILWILAPAGQTFQAGKPSGIYLTMVEVANGLDQRKRETVLWAFTRRWAEILDVDIECLAVAATDSSTVAKFLRGNRNRLRTISRPGFMVSTIFNILRTRLSDGFAQLRVNL